MGDLSKHYSRSEFLCSCGCGNDSVDYETVMVAEDVREHFGAPVTITSAYRCLTWNRVPVDEGGPGSTDGSQHPRARAIDIKVEGVEPSVVFKYLDTKYPTKYGIGVYNSFTHLDTRTGGLERWSSGG